MRFKSSGPKQDYVLVNIVNNDTVTIKKGAPVFLDPTADGIKVLSVESLPDAKQAFFFGLSILDLAPGVHGEASVFGFFESARILLRSRAASTDSWPALDEGAAGCQLQFLSNTGLQALFVDAPEPPLQEGPFLVLAQSFSSAASVASTASDTSIYSTTTLRALVRCM